MAIIKEITDMTNTAKAIIKEMASYTVISHHLLSRRIEVAPHPAITNYHIKI